MVADAHGFEWAAERPTKETFVQQKWGYRSRTAGAWIELEVRLGDRGARPSMTVSQVATVVES